MQNDHLAAGGPLEVPRARNIVPALAARLEAARREGVPIVYVVDQHEADDSDLDSWGTHNVKGSPGAEVWPALAPHACDRVVSKPTYSAFSRSNLADVLRELRVDTLELTGCLTEVGLVATATDALQRGYAVEIPPETQAGATELNERITLGVLSLLPPYGPARAELLAAVRG
jgi:nicotinamidase-related amidase